jgi:uncharacterized protein (TIGR00369 family)
MSLALKHLNLDKLPPHAEAIGMQFVGIEGRTVTVRVPYAKHLIGDPDTGVIHGGVMTTTLDNASGWAIRCHEDWTKDNSMATLDLRIDYMRPATPNEDLVVQAECYKLTRNVAFVRGLAHQGDPGNPVAASTATFMLGTPSGPRP